jgi:hypothetical protein
MSMLVRSLAAAIFATSAFAGAAHAMETINIPSTEANVVSDSDSCIKVPGYGIRSQVQSPAECVLELSLGVPIGHSVKQIAVIDSDYPVNYGHIETYLHTTAIAPPWDEGQEFDYDTYGTGPRPQAHKLMLQSGKAFPDAFIVEGNEMYRVVVKLSYGHMLYGISVSYE